MERALELENALSSLLSWHPSEDEWEIAQAWIDWLDKVRQAAPSSDSPPAHDVTKAIASIDATDELYGRAMRRLRGLCRDAGCLPASCTLPSDITYDHIPISSSGYSDIYRGLLQGRAVALKVLRVHVDTRAKVTKARACVRQRVAQTKITVC